MRVWANVVKLIKTPLSVEAACNISGKLGAAQVCKTGLKQGCPFSPTLFGRAWVPQDSLP